MTATRSIAHAVGNGLDFKFHHTQLVRSASEARLPGLHHKLLIHPRLWFHSTDFEDSNATSDLIWTSPIVLLPPWISDQYFSVWIRFLLICLDRFSCKVRCQRWFYKCGTSYQLCFEQWGDQLGSKHFNCKPTRGSHCQLQVDPDPYITLLRFNSCSNKLA